MREGDGVRGEFAGTSPQGTRSQQEADRKSFATVAAFLDLQPFLPSIPASWRYFLFRGSGGAAMNTARCEQGHEKSPRLLLECCPKLTWAGQVGDTKGESHEQIPLAFRAKKKKKEKVKTHIFPPVQKHGII